MRVFRRETSTGSYIREIDGLRFLAIVLVILFHLNGFFLSKNSHVYSDRSTSYAALFRLVSNFHVGVEFFFVISGFVLALPFGKYYFLGGEKVSLKRYFLRRATRLEPPYFLVMIILFLAHAFVIHAFNIVQLVKSLLASLFYMHLVLFAKAPLINSVAWSLEIEVQFYLVAPLIALVFSRAAFYRRFVLIGAAFFFIICQHFVQFKVITIYNYVQYFIVGFLLADIYLNKITWRSNRVIDFFMGLCALGVMLFLNILLEGLFWKIVFPFIICAFYYLVLVTRVWNFIFRLNVLAILGGMCYSIYLIDYPIISMAGNKLIMFKFTNSYLFDYLIFNILMILIVFFAGSVLFLLVEKPCMRRDWHKTFIRTVKNLFKPKKHQPNVENSNYGS